MVETQVCVCGLCGQDVDPEKESYIQSLCSQKECGESIWHVECIRDYLESGQADKRGCCNSKKAMIKKVYINNRPWQHLKSRNCPVGRGKLAGGKEAEPCPGRVEESDFHELKKKKKQPKNGEPQPQKAMVKAPTKTTLPQAAAKPASKAIERRPLQHNNFDNFNQYNRPRKRHEREGDLESLHSNTSKGSQYVFADNVAWGAEEEIEAAISQGFLGEDYRTNLCQTVAESRPCHLANRCQHAHSLRELRLNAAIALEKIPPDFKTALCDNFLITGTCTEGIACYRAHSLEELRIVAAIQQNLLPPNFKTERCSAYDTSQKCPRGEMCPFAHGSKQLRVEAAIQAGKLPKDFKCHLCPLWWAGRTCPDGDNCSNAHGLQELRVQAAFNQELIKDLYKTEKCTKPTCSGPLGRTNCWFFHSEQDQLKPLSYKSQLCKTWKETGTCEYGDKCHFAHDAKEISIQSVASNFVEKSAEGDDTISQISNDDSVDVHGRRDVGIVPYAVLNGKMPVAIPQAGKQRRRGAKGAALQLCAHFERTGQCPDPDCRFAHGVEELKRRQAKAKGGDGSGAPKAFNPALAPAPRKLSPGVLEAIRSHKLQAAVTTLMGLGFAFAVAENAARTTGANVEMAAQLLLDGGGDHHETGVTEVTVREEVDAVCAMADSLDLTTKEVETEILRWHGNHQKALQELQDIKLNGGRRPPPPPPRGRPATIPEEDSSHEYMNEGWKNMEQPTWGPTTAAPNGPAPAATTYLATPLLLPHNASTSIITPHYVPQAANENTSAAEQAEEWQQYRPEDFGPDPVVATGSDPEADLRAALLASMADAPPLGPATLFQGSETAGAHHQANRAQPAAQQPQTNPPPVPNGPPASAPASRNWFPATSDTAAFKAGGGTAAANVSDALAHLRIAPLQNGSAHGYDEGLASGEITPQPSVNYDLSPQSVILTSDGPATTAQQLLPWLSAAGTAADASALVPASVPSKASTAAPEGGGTEDFDNLMAMLMS